LLLRVANVRYEAAVNIEAASGKQEHAATLNKPLSPGYFGQITIVNSTEIALTRKKLASVFLSDEEANEFERTFEVISIDGIIVPFDNQNLKKKILEYVQPKYLEDGTVKVIVRQSYMWTKAVQLICHKFGFAEFLVEPATKPIVDFIQIKTTGSSKEHSEKMAKARALLRKIKANYVQECLSSGPCSTVGVRDFVDSMRKGNKKQ